MQTFQFQPIFGYFWIGVVVATLLGLLAVRPSFANLTINKRFVLAAIRTLTVCLLALAMLRPGCVTTTHERQSALLVFLIDISRSMQLPHRSQQVKRWDELQSVMEANYSRIDALRNEKVDVRFIAFDNQSRPLEWENGRLKLPAKPDGAQTDIGTAIEVATRGFRDQRLIGVVLASDGVQNSVDSDVELLDAARSLAIQEVPLYAVPFGMPAEVGRLADVAISNLPDHDTVFVKNRKVVRASLVSRGFANQPVTVQLVIKGKSDTVEKIVDSKVYTPSQSYQEQNIELSYTPDLPGSYRMSVRAVALPNESATLNNELTSFLTVYEGGLRVLMISTLDNNEQSRIRRSIPAVGGRNASTQAIELDFFPIYTDARSRQTTWPVVGALTEAIKNPAFDVIILNNIDSRALYKKGVNEENLIALEQAVAAGKGLMMIGGTHSFGPGLYHETPLADVLPIMMNGFDRQEFDRDIRKEYHLTGPLKWIPTLDHELVHLRDSGDLQETWTDMPAMPGANRFEGVKDTGTVLLTSQDDDPILVWGMWGRGRVLAMAADSTWLWHSHGFQAEHKRFWQQVILWLAFPDGSAKDNLRIFMDQRRYQPQSEIIFNTEARTITGQVIEDASYTAILTDPDGDTTPITISRFGNGNRGTISPELASKSGVYSIAVSATHDGGAIGNSEVEFSVYDNDREKSNLAADPQMLERLANETKEFGGRAVLPEDVGQLLDEVVTRIPELDVAIPKRWRMGDTSLDASAFLALFVTVMTCEWYFRKKWGMV